MKRLLIVASAALLALSTSSCGDLGGNTLNSGKATRLVQKEMARIGADRGVGTITTGYFECNDNDIRYAFRCLAANELVTYQCEIVKKKEMTRRYRKVTYWGYTYREPYYVDTMVNTYFVTVELTDKGKKFLADTDFVVKPCEDILDLRLDRKPDKTKYPEATVEYIEFEGQAPLEPKDKDESATADSVAEDSVDYADDFEGIDEGFFGEAEGSADISEAETAYEKAKAKEHQTYVAVNMCKLKVVKVRNIVANRSEQAVAEGEAVVEYRDVTPFGRILGKIKEGERIVEDDLHFVYYEDKGWQLKRSKGELENELEAYRKHLDEQNNTNQEDE